MMKTLTKPSGRLTAEITFNQAYRQNRLEISSFQYRKSHSKWKILLLLISFFTFIVVSDTPEMDAEICNRFHSEQVCKIW